MIRINLLPVRAAKKKETAKQQLVVAAVAVVAVLAVMLALWFFKLGQIKEEQRQIDEANARIVELTARIGKLNELKKLKEAVKKKLDVLAELRKNKTGPATRLATLSDVTPDQLWLESYKESGKDIRISGLAYNEELIAQFIRAVEDSPEYENVELLVSEQKDLGGTKLKRFDLTFKLEAPKPK